MSAEAQRREALETESRLLRLPFLDEALAIREWRRARRWLLGSGVPLLYVLGTILLPWLVVPALYSAPIGSCKHVMGCPSLPFTAVEDDPHIAPVIKLPPQLRVSIQPGPGDYE